MKLSAAWDHLKNSMNEYQIFFKRKKFEIGIERSKIRHKTHVWVRENERFCLKMK
jgi:hypothetical protein